MQFNDIFCILMTFHNPIKASFSNKKYKVLMQTRPTQIENSVFPNLTSVLIVFLLIIGE